VSDAGELVRFIDSGDPFDPSAPTGLIDALASSRRVSRSATPNSA
jgi:hypothetical protein